MMVAWYRILSDTISSLYSSHQPNDKKYDDRVGQVGRYYDYHLDGSLLYALYKYIISNN